MAQEIDSFMTTSSSEAFDVFGVLIQFLVSPEQTGGEITLYRGTLTPGIVVPLHSHPEPEVFYVRQGVLEVYQESGAQQGWSKTMAGNAIAIPPNMKHALRNLSGKSTTTLAVAQDQLYGFFREISKPFTGQAGMPPSPEQMQHLFAIAAKYSYWMGSPEENAAIGLRLG